MFFIVLTFVFVTGAILGSFSVAQVWRIRAAQLKTDLSAGEKIDQDEWKKLKHLAEDKKRRERSHCLNCGYQLKWYDLIPIFSWLSLKGKCRKCHSPIGWTEFIAELSLVLVLSLVFITNFSFLASVDVNFVQVARFVLMIICLSMMLIMFVYDAKWSLLPAKTMYSFIVVAVIYWIISIVQLGSTDYVSAVASLMISMLIFPALYFALSFLSKGEWVGEGDWILAAGLIFLLPNQPIYSAIAMFLSNIFGIFAVLALSMVKKQKVKRGVKIPFGPMMILAAVVIIIFSQYFANMINFLV